MRDEDILAFVPKNEENGSKGSKKEKERHLSLKDESAQEYQQEESDFEDYEPEMEIDAPVIENGFENAFGIITTGIDPLEITEAGARITGYISTSRRSDIRLGTYVIVPYGDEDLFARIWKLQYLQEYAVDDATEIHSRRMLRFNHTDEVDYKFLAYLDPICILYEQNTSDGSFLARRMGDRIPRPNTPILPVTEKLKIQTGLNIPEEGIFLGHLSVGGELVKTHAVPPTVPYYLRNDYSMGDPLIFRHMLVCGSTGTGKTFLTKNILRQFMSEDNRYNLRGSPEKKNPCLVIMDPQDEYSQLYEDNPDLTSDDDFIFGAEQVNFGACKNTKTFVAKVNGETYNGRSRAEQVEFTIPFEMVRNNSWLIAPVGMTELQYVGVDLLLDDYFKRSGQHTYSGFVDFIDDDAARDHYVESGKIHESSYDGIVRRVKNRALARVFDQPARPITEILGQIFKSGQVSVFPTEYITSSRIRDLITLTLMSMIVDNKLSTSGEAAVKETPIILGLDEAHRYLAKAGGEHSRMLISKFADAARQGRKEGLGLFLITQDPQDIDETVFKQINTRVILNLSNDAAISAMKVKKEFEKRIPYLKKGQMIIQSPDNSDMVEIIGLSKCVVKHI
ncbi:ATP-binding protein [Methanolobus zinderi]|uniref:ATP-binding protein n=1 Tax=Methanolobus zinderi TaxID=536044 RepID=A0A7D5IN12_9EURY|nr:ATP-binding protein [Methanolobus zinderi]QLC48987.1 ATP-binding protein [Methanolobus zinderi]